MLDWALVIGLAGTMAWTTLCLGGYLAETMVYTSTALFGLGILGAARLALVPRGEPIRVNLAVLLPVPFLLYALASVLWIAPARWLAWREWLTWLLAWLVFVIVLHTGRSRAATRFLAGTCVAVGIAAAAMAAYQRFIDPKWMMLGRVQAEQFWSRSAGCFGSPNSLASLLELMTPPCLVLLFSRRVGVAGRILSGWLAAVFLFAIVLTGSRGSWISLGLALIAWPLLGNGNWRRRLGGAVAIATILAAGLVLLYQFSGSARGRIDPFLAGKFESSRPVIWRIGLQIWQTSPWFGTGAASYNILFNQYRPNHFQNEPEWTHNDYLNMLSDFGVLGSMLWMMIGVAVLGLGWQGVQRLRRDGADSAAGNWRWRFGLWLGLLAVTLHMFVDFQTKIPALAFALAVAAAFFLRDHPRLERNWRGGGQMRFLAAVVVIALGLLSVRRALPVYRSEATRFEPRTDIDRDARSGEARWVQLSIPASVSFRRATDLDPLNGQAWADLSYATQLSWHVKKGESTLLGLLARQQADRAISLCPVIAEFWLRRGAAARLCQQDNEAMLSFERAVKLAPNNPEVWYFLAFHLAASRGRQTEALQAVETCLSLDPSFRAALTLRDRLRPRHL